MKSNPIPFDANAVVNATKEVLASHNQELTVPVNSWSAWGQQITKAAGTVLSDAPLENFERKLDELFVSITQRVADRLNLPSQQILDQLLM